jgi:hypothetical protein
MEDHIDLELDKTALNCAWETFHEALDTAQPDALAAAIKRYVWESTHLLSSRGGADETVVHEHEWKLQRDSSVYRCHCGAYTHENDLEIHKGGKPCDICSQSDFNKRNDTWENEKGRIVP